MNHNTGAATRSNRKPFSHRSTAFSLVELVMVISIISIISAIAVPRVANAARDAKAHALAATVANVRAAIDHYYAEHGQFPGYNPASGTPDGTWFVDQLTKYSAANGMVNDTPSSRFLFGPYLRLPFPINPLNNKKNVKVKAKSTGMVMVGSSGWIAGLEDGAFGVNASSAQLARINVSTNEGIRLQD